MEHTMFAFLLHHLGHFFERAERRRRDDYLASSSNLADLERRMREVDSKSYPF
jgi:hypothetical protein